MTHGGDGAPNRRQLSRPRDARTLRESTIAAIRSIDLRFVEELVEFVRGRGYVLDFSDPSFSDFFAAELDVDIDDPIYAENGGSKGKRLRCFLQKGDAATAARTLKALWEHRSEYLAHTDQPDPVVNAEGRFLSLIARLADNSEPGTVRHAPVPATDWRLQAELKNGLVAMASLPPQERGYAFEAFLRQAFDAAGLAAREPFRNLGEQIDGSFLLGHEIYLLEAKWTASQTGVADLHGFHGKLEQKASWARGLFVSYNGFSEQGLVAFGSGKRLICMDGRDLYDALERLIPLAAVLERKIRGAAETGRAFIAVHELFASDPPGAFL